MAHQPDNSFSLKARLRSFVYAFAGIKATWKSQHNFRIHIVAGILVIILGLLLGLSKSEWLFISLAIGFVLFAEILNSSLEYLVDIISPQKNEKAGLAKDMAAGAVLVAAITALVVGLLIFVPKIINLL